MKLAIIFLYFICTLQAWAFYELDGTSSHINGPNCWNGALVATKILKHKRFVHPEEWRLHLKRHCISTENPTEGSVGRITTPEGEEVHGFIHLNSETIFAKHGESAMHGYQIMSYNKMMDQYGKKRECRISNSNEAHCLHITKYYNCKSSQKMNSHLHLILALIEQMVFSNETQYTYQMKCNGPVHLQREELLSQIEAELHMLAKYDKKLRDRELESVVEKSLSHQLYNIKVGYRLFRCKNRKKRDSRINRVLDNLKLILGD